MKRSLFYTVVSLILLGWGGTTMKVIAADDWNYPATRPESPFGGGNGSSSSPYLISNARQLANLAYMVNNGNSYKGKHFKLTADVVLNDNVLDSEGKPGSGTFKQWTPIGRYGYFSNDDFMGIFDGDGHTIKGLYISDSAERYQGLFGSVKNAVLC